MAGFWKDAHDEGGLAWDDSNNNRAFLGGTISSTSNAASIYIETLRKPDQYRTEKGAPMKDDILHAPYPKGPGGEAPLHPPQTHMVMGYSKNQKAAKDFLRWAHSRKNFEKWFMSQKAFSIPATREWSKHALWNEDPVMAPFRDVILKARAPGWPGPSGRKAARSYPIHHHRYVREGRARHAARGRGEVLDVDLGAGFDDLADHLAAGADHFADLVGRNIELLDTRGVFAELRARLGQGLRHLAEDVQAAILCLRQRDLHDLFGDTGDLDVHLQRGIPTRCRPP